MVTTRKLHVRMRGQGDVYDLTPGVLAALADAQLSAGIVTIFVTGSTAGVTTIEFEPGAVSDLDRTFERIAPRGADYAHHMRWGDDNGSSHVRAAMLGPSVTVPFAEGRLALGTWQQIVLVEFDTGPRSRDVMVQFVGDPIDQPGA